MMFLKMLEHRWLFLDRQQELYLVQNLEELERSMDLTNKTKLLIFETKIKSTTKNFTFDERIDHSTGYQYDAILRFEE